MTQRDLLARAVSRRFGLQPRDSWPQQLREGLEAIKRRYGLDEAAAYERAEAVPALLRELAGSLTVPEAFFFRLPEQLNLTVGVVAAGLHRGTGDITVWSAGCAQGEEPYSVAMLLDAKLGGAWHDRVRIIASDISLAAVEAARRGLYTEWSLRATPPALRARYFADAGGGHSRLQAAITARVAFEHLAVCEHLAQLATSSVDLVLFRNVSIYLDAASLTQICDGLVRVLKPGGMLVVAPADPAPPPGRFRRVAAAPAGVLEPAVSLDAAAVPPATAARVARSAVLPPLEPASDARVAAVGLAEAVALADRGEVAAALRLVDGILLERPDATSARLLRGQIQLSASQVEAAVGDLRACVFLNPDNKLARYWYAIALRKAGASGQCVSQLRELSRQLAGLPAETALEDGRTRARELSEAVERMRGSIE